MPPTHPLITHDPLGGGELIVTRLECPATGAVIEGRFSLGWIAHLTPDQLAFVGQLLRKRGNVQRLSANLGIAYNTARNRLDEIVAALEAADASTPRPLTRPARIDLLHQLAAGTITIEEALHRLRP